jgi:diketogulonate reductase-like aldo/keto reductase
MNDKHNPEEVVDALKDSLKLLGLDYLDLYLIHWPMSAIVSYILIIKEFVFKFIYIT